MQTHDNSHPQKQSNAAAHQDSPQIKHTVQKSAPQDNRPEAAYQRKIIEMVNQSPQVAQMRKLQATANDWTSKQSDVKPANEATVQRKIEFHNNLLGGGKKTVTNGGTSNVEGIGKDILAAKAEIAGISGLRVVAGYHGDDAGKFAGAFNAEELQLVDKIAALFDNITLEKRNSELPDEEVVSRILTENIFYTWCFADRRILNLVHAEREKRSKASDAGSAAAIGFGGSNTGGASSKPSGAAEK
jgi:hypothetical protein